LILGYIAVAASSFVLLAACALTQPGVPDPVEQSLVNAMTNTLAPGVNAAIAKGVAAAGPEINAMAYALPWAEKALDTLGPPLGVVPAKIAALDGLIRTAEADLANPPTSAGAAVVEAAAAWQQVRAVLAL
jgi:hypothetical protein